MLNKVDGRRKNINHFGNFRTESQKERVLNYLYDHGSISNAEAIFELNIFRASAVIELLRKDKVYIHTYLGEDNMAVYVLDGQPTYNLVPFMIHTKDFGLLTYKEFV